MLAKGLAEFEGAEVMSTVLTEVFIAGLPVEAPFLLIVGIGVGGAIIGESIVKNIANNFLDRFTV